MYDDDLVLSELNELLSSDTGLYPTLKKQCEGNVSRWEWSADSAYFLEPFWFELRNIKRGRKLSLRPDSSGKFNEYGLDSLGRVIVARSYANGTCYERFTLYSEGKIDEYGFGNEENKPLNGVRRAFRTGDRIDQLYWLGVNVLEIMRYEYEGDLLAWIYKKLPKQNRQLSYLLEYDDLGSLERILWSSEPRPEGPSRVLYVRPPANAKQRRAELSRDLAHRIAADFPRLIAVFRSEHPDEHCYGIVLINEGDDTHIECAIGTEEGLQAHAVRREAARGRGNEQSLILQADRWAPFDFFYFYEFDKETVSKPLQKAYDAAILERGHYQTWDICLAALMMVNESGVLATEFGPDTVALAIDNEEDSWHEKSLKKANPKQVVNRVMQDFKAADKASMRLP